MSRSQKLLGTSLALGCMLTGAACVTGGSDLDPAADTGRRTDASPSETDGGGLADAPALAPGEDAAPAADAPSPPADATTPGTDAGPTASACTPPTTTVDPAEQLFVAPKGSDSAAGTSDAPMATLGAAAKKLPTGGTIIVRGGTYGAQRLAAKGTAGHPLVIRAADGETPVFDGGAVTGSYNGVIAFSVAQHVVLRGLEIANCTASECSGIDTVPVDDFTLENCHIHHLDGAAVDFTGKHVRILGNHVHDTAQVSIKFPDGGWPSCIGTAPDRAMPATPHTDDVIVRGNRVEHCGGEGIGMWFASNLVVEDNFVDDAFNVGIYLDNTFNVRIARNFVRMSRGIHGSAGTGILMGTEPYPSWGLTGSSVHDVSIVDNVVAGVAGGIGWWSSDDTTANNTYSNISIVHNTVVTDHNAFGFDLVGAGRPAPTGCVVKNNVFVEKSPSSLGAPSAFAVAQNAWLNGKKPSIAGATDVALTVALGPIATATDLEALAAAVGNGESGLGVTTDFVCNPRSTKAPVRGAFEK